MDFWDQKLPTVAVMKSDKLAPHCGWCVSAPAYLPCTQLGFEDGGITQITRFRSTALNILVFEPQVWGMMVIYFMKTQ